MRSDTLAICLFFFLSIVPEGLLADFPEDPPNDPAYDYGEEIYPEGSIYDSAWWLFGFPTKYAPELGVTGISANIAWQRTIGRKDVLVAILDAGTAWDRSDTMYQYYLNRGELPLPQNASGEESDRYDANGDGAFNALDYAEDPRVFDGNGNGVLDTQDILRSFEDGRDDDGNGYIDDISGWDFWEEDNDPYDPELVWDYRHANLIEDMIAAEGNNGIGGIGTAPNVTIVHLRIGDAFIADASRLAAAVVFAVDHGAAVVTASGVILGNPRFVQEAIAYAHRHDVVVVAGAGDEATYHHNDPATLDDVIGIGAIVPNNMHVERLPLRTFLAKDNCSNFGAHVPISVPSDRGCASSSAGTAGGIAALIVSAGRDLADAEGTTPLSAEEVRQLFLLSADDIDEPERPTTYPSYPGFDEYFGYGRANVGRAVSWVTPTTIPPEVDIDDPDWFTTLDPLETPEVSVIGRVAAPRANTFRYRVTYGIGVAPRSWEEIFVSETHPAPVEGVLARWRIADVALPGFDAPPQSPHAFAVTLRVEAEDDFGNRGEDRMTWFLHHDADLHPGFPRSLGTSGDASPTLADLDGDGILDIVLPTSDGSVLALHGDGTSLSGWPVATLPLPDFRPENPGNHRDAPAYRSGAVSPAGSPIESSAAVGDLDGDGDLEVVCATFYGEVYAWHHDGTLLPGFPLRPDRGTDPGSRRIYAAPTLGDLDGDGDLEIVVGAFDQRLYAWHHDGTPVSGFPVLLRTGEETPAPAKIVSTAAIGDLDGDGKNEIVVGTNEDTVTVYGLLYALHGDGSFVSGWPARIPTLYDHILPMIGRGVPASPILFDLDRDGRLEVAASAVTSRVTVLDHRGRRIRSFSGFSTGRRSPATDLPTLAVISNSSVADLDRDGDLDLVSATTGLRFGAKLLLNGIRFEHEHHVGAWDIRTKRPFPSFPRIVEDLPFFLNPAIADLDGDGFPEIVTGSSGYLLHAWNVRGVEPAGWPKFTGGWLLGSPAVGDVDGDGRLEVVAVTMEGNLYLWDTPGPATTGAVSWGGFHHDARNSGNFETPLP